MAAEYAQPGGSVDPALLRVTLGHLSIDPLPCTAVVDAVTRLVESGEGGTVFMPNVDHVVLAEDDIRFRKAYEHAALSCPDGANVNWAARLLGAPMPHDFHRADVVVPLMDRARQRHWRVYLLGSAYGVVEKAAVELKRRLPGLSVVGTSSPSIDMSQLAAARAPIVADIRKSRAQMVLVALGAPKEELFIDEAQPRLRSTVLLGVGATLDFLANATHRPPEWMSTMGLDWLYRLSREPRRLWRRYLLRDPRFVAILLKQRWEMVASVLESSWEEGSR